MTAHRDLKARIRARMAKTGEAYSTARMHVLSERERWFGTRASQKPARPRSGPLFSIEIDPRFELMSVLARLARCKNRGMVSPTAYSRDVDEHFGRFRQHPAVQTVVRLEREKGFNYWYLIGLGSRLVDTQTLAERMPFESPAWDQNAQWTAEDMEALVVELRDFVRASDWAAFERRKLDDYREAVRRVEGVVDPPTLGSWLDGYLGTRGTARFVLTPAFLLGPARYSSIIEFADGSTELYGYMGWSSGVDERGISLVDSAVTPLLAAMLFFILRVNAEVSICDADLRPATKDVFSLLEPELFTDYGQWHECVAESLQYSLALRFVAATQGRKAVEKWLAWFKSEFFWIEKLFALFDEYEQDRTRYPKLSDFMPHVATFFAELGASIDPERFREQRQVGIGQRDAKAPRIVRMQPPDGAEGVDPDLVAIQVTFDRAMSPHGQAIVTVPDAAIPDIPEWPHYDDTCTVLAVPVQLEPETTYALSFNSERHLGIRDQEGNALKPTLCRFRTGPRKEERHGA